MKKFVAFLVSLFIVAQASEACTSAIVSGRATPDGRPILWKHRDSDSEKNKLMYFEGKKYDFIGVVNSEDTEGIWMGSNSAGFSIMNTASYNIEIKGKNRKKDEEGLLMKKALAECQSVQDFERLLLDTKGKWGVAANFGAIDAKGGAAYFETGSDYFVKFDLNDPLVAPKGYLIRTNFSFSGPKEKGQGYIRYSTAENLFNIQYMKNDVSLDFILRDADRNLENSLLKNNLYDMDLPDNDATEHFVPFRDYIVRNSSVSSMVVQGVKPGEDPALTTVWTVLGFPLTTLVTPVWVAAGADLPSVTVAISGQTSPVNEKALKLKGKCFPVKYGNGSGYINIAAVLNKKGTGIAQRLLPKESAIIDKVKSLLSSWRSKGFNKLETKAFYSWLDGYVTGVYLNEFGI